jgi:hypothetical protein
MSVKRLNYFHYQFLQEQDFSDEQEYHLSMRRRHNQNYHTWGRVQGLEVMFAPGARKVTISPGMAVDGTGREIIVESNQEVDLQSYAGQSVYLVLAYKEGETDPTTQAGVSGNTRITESFQTKVYSAASAPAWDTSLELIIAKITLNAAPPASDGAVTAVDASERTEAGAKIGQSAFPGLKLMVPAHGASEWPEVEGVEVGLPGSGLQGIAVTAARTTFSANVVVNGDLTVKGVVNKTDELVIKDNVIRVNAYDLPAATPLNINGGLEVYRGGTAPNAQIIWEEATDRWKLGVAGTLNNLLYGPNMIADGSGNVGIGGNPRAGAKLEVSGGSLFISQANDFMQMDPWSGSNGCAVAFYENNVQKANLYWHKPSQTFLVNSAGASNTVLNRNGGAVGIGTTNPPLAPLHVGAGTDNPTRNGGIYIANPNGSAQLDMRDSAADIEFELFTHAPIYGGFSGHVFLGTFTNHRLVLRTNDADRVMITESGKVGIGNINPDRTLDISGTMRASSEIQTTSANAFRMVYGNYGSFLRNDGADNYFLLTNSGDQYGNWNALRPLRINNASGDVYVHGSSLYVRASDGKVGIGTTTPANKLDVLGDIAVNGKHAVRGSDSWLRLNQDGAFTSGVHTPGVFAPMSLNVGGAGSWGNPGDGNLWATGNIGSHGYNPSAGLPSGWGGGVHTWDVAAHGTGRAVSGWQTGGWDLAEKFDRYDKSLEYGDVVAADPDNPERLIKASSPYQKNLLGVISEKPGFLLGVSWEDPKYPIALALAGRVPVRVNLHGGAIRIGDYLTSSSEPGYAMKADNSGRVIGIALEPFDGDQGNKGKIILFINPQWVRRDEK